MENNIDDLTPHDLQSQILMSPSRGSTWNNPFEMRWEAMVLNNNKARYAL